MKRINAYLATIILLFSIQTTHGSETRKDIGRVIFDLKNTFPHRYSLHLDYISSFFSSGQITIIKLTKPFSSKTIAQFQPPLSLTQKEYPRFSQDGRFLLILSATWSPTYQASPTEFEWHLFDTQAQKTIKKFPKAAYPQFDETKNQIICVVGYPSFHLPSEPAQGFFSSAMNTFKNSFSWLSTKSPQTTPQTKPTSIMIPDKTTSPTKQTSPKALTFTSRILPKEETNKDLILSLNRKRILSSRIKTKSDGKPSLNEKKEEIVIEDNDDDEESFSSVIEESMHRFKQYIDNNENEKASSAINDIITELATEDESGTVDNQITVIENYKKYSPITQKKFVSNLIEEYKKQSSEIKEKYAETLFSPPYGNLYRPKDKEKNEIKNRSNNVVAIITTVKINNQDQDILTISSIATQNTLLTYPLIQSIRSKTFSASGKKFALSYENKPHNTHATLVVFTQEHNTLYMPKIYPIKNSPEIIGLLFLDDFTLLTLDKDYSMTVMYLPKDQ